MIHHNNANQAITQSQAQHRPATATANEDLNPLLTATRATKKPENSSTIQILSATHALRPKAETFIKDIFQQHHHAQVSSFLPTLLATFDESGSASSVLGFRNAQDQSLYLERYLDQNIETLIQSFSKNKVQRAQVVEIGNLASKNSASCQALFVNITQHLQDTGVHWITCTGTSVLRIVFRRLGIRAVAIHEADQNRLGDEQYSWGNYYDHEPQVMLIDVKETNQHFIDRALKARHQAGSKLDH